MILLDVYSIATQKPLYKGPEDTLFEAVELMVKHKFRRIPVVYVEAREEIEELIGIVTANDVLELVDIHGLKVLDAQLQEVMIPDPIAVPREEDLGRATEIMVVNNFGGLPIVSDQMNTIAGIVTERDLVKAFVKSIADATLQEFMTEPMTMPMSRSTVKKVLKKMHKERASRIILTGKDNSIEGIITNSDLLTKIYNAKISGTEEDFMKTPLKQVATKNVITVNVHDSMADVARFLLEKGLGGVPVLDDDGTLVGMFSERELLNMIGTFQLFSEFD